MPNQDTPSSNEVEAEQLRRLGAVRDGFDRTTAAAEGIEDMMIAPQAVHDVFGFMIENLRSSKECVRLIQQDRIEAARDMLDNVRIFNKKHEVCEAAVEAGHTDFVQALLDDIDDLRAWAIEKDNGFTAETQAEIAECLEATEQLIRGNSEKEAGYRKEIARRRKHWLNN